MIAKRIPSREEIARLIDPHVWLDLKTTSQAPDQLPPLVRASLARADRVRAIYVEQLSC